MEGAVQATDTAEERSDLELHGNKVLRTARMRRMRGNHTNAYSRMNRVLRKLRTPHIASHALKAGLDVIAW